MHAGRSALALIVTVLPVLSGLAEASQPAGAGSPGAPAAQITFSGRVTDPQGKPVEGAEVTLYQMTAGELGVLPKVEVIDRKTTGADGAFAFAVARGANAYREGRVIARKEGLSLAWAAWPMREDQRLDIALGRPVELAGDVVDEAGQPIADAEVHIAMAKIGKGEDLRELEAAGFLRTRTDRNGHFVFADMPAGATFEFRVERPGRATIHTLELASYSRDQCQFAPGQAGIRLTLPVEARVEGVVVEKAGGKPVGGVQVKAHADRRQGASLPSKSAVTAQDGTFRIGGLSAGSCIVELSTIRGQMPEWVAEEVRTSLQAGETKSDIQIQLTKGAIIEVLVKDPAGKPGERVGAYLRRVRQEQGFGSTTDENGLARIRVIPGDYSIAQIFRPGYVPPETTEQVTVAEGETKRIECTVRPTPKITGIVRDEAGTPLAGVKVQATWIRMLSTMTSEATSDASGKFDIPWDSTPMSRGASAVLFVARDPLRNLVQALDIDEHTGPLDLRLQPGVIVTGTALTPEGKPLPGANARVELRVSRATVRLGWRELATAGPDGTFEIKAIPPEREYAVTIAADGYGKQEISVNSLDLKENRHDLGRVKLALGDLSVSGLVVDPNDNPVAGADVSASGAGQPDLRNIQTDAQGRFTIKGVCPGPIRLSVSSRGPSLLYGYAQAEGGATDVRIIVSERRSAQPGVPRKGASLKGRPLQAWKDLGISLLADTEGKLLLLCFWDVGQRPSRYCVTQLAAQVGSLKEKGVTVVAIQAAGTGEGTLTRWVQENRIPFPIGSIPGDIDKIRSAWGVTSLPHLILTDKKHMVVAEGFGVNDLDKQIEAAAGR